MRHVGKMHKVESDAAVKRFREERKEAAALKEGSKQGKQEDKEMTTELAR